MNSAFNKGKTESGDKRLGQTQKRVPLLTDLREAGQKGYAIEEKVIRYAKVVVGC